MKTKKSFWKKNKTILASILVGFFLGALLYYTVSLIILVNLQDLKSDFIPLIFIKFIAELPVLIVKSLGAHDEGLAASMLLYWLLGGAIGGLLMGVFGKK